MAGKKTKRAEPEANPPSKFLRTKSGTECRIIKCSERSATGKKQYRLHFVADGVSSHKKWTLGELEDAGVEWLED